MYLSPDHQLAYGSRREAAERQPILYRCDKFDRRESLFPLRIKKIFKFSILSSLIYFMECLRIIFNFLSSLRSLKSIKHLALLHSRYFTKYLFNVEAYEKASRASQKERRMKNHKEEINYKFRFSIETLFDSSLVI